MKKLVAIVFAFSLIAPSPAQASQIQCADGTYTKAKGKGACSHHGGIAIDPSQINAANSLLQKQAQIDYIDSLRSLYLYEGKYTKREVGNDTVEICIDSPFNQCFNLKTWNIPSQKTLFKESRLAAPCKNKTKLKLNNNYYTCLNNKFKLTGNVLGEK